MTLLKTSSDPYCSIALKALRYWNEVRELRAIPKVSLNLKNGVKWRSIECNLAGAGRAIALSLR